MEIAPFKPMPKPLSVIHAQDKVKSFEASPQVRPAKGQELRLLMLLSTQELRPSGNVVMMVLSFLLSLRLTSGKSGVPVDMVVSSKF